MPATLARVHPWSQVCATSRYLEGDTAVMRPGPLVATQGAQAITAPGVLSPDSRVVPFTVRPADAREQALEWIRCGAPHGRGVRGPRAARGRALAHARRRRLRNPCRREETQIAEAYYRQATGCEEVRRGT